MAEKIDARNVSEDTYLVVRWTSATTPSQWEWHVATEGTVGVGGSLSRLSYYGYSQNYDIAVQKGMEKMMQVCPIDVIGAGTTWHTTGTNVIRTGAPNKNKPTGWVGGRGGYISKNIYTKDSIKGT